MTQHLPAAVAEEHEKESEKRSFFLAHKLARGVKSNSKSIIVCLVKHKEVLKEGLKIKVIEKSEGKRKVSSNE